MAKELDNKKMWESFIEYKGLPIEMRNAIHLALEDQGLKWNGKEIVEINETSDFKIEAGKSYMCIKETLNIQNERFNEIISKYRGNPVYDKFVVNLQNWWQNTMRAVCAARVNERYGITGISSKKAEGKLGELIKNIEEEKSEPKFKVGDWVVNKFGDVWHIDSFDKKNYQVSNGNEYNYFPISKQNEMHLSLT